MGEEVVKGDKIIIHNKDGTSKFAKCTGVTHGNLIHFMYNTGEGYPVAGMVGRDFVEKVNEITLSELYAEASRLSLRWWGVEYDGSIEIVNRRWKRCRAYIQIKPVDIYDYSNVKNGDYRNGTEYTIKFSRHKNSERSREEIYDTLLHELVHWRLHSTGKRYRDDSREFVEECERVGASFSGTKSAQEAVKYYSKKGAM
jgi:hypothetical protein